MTAHAEPEPSPPPEPSQQPSDLDDVDAEHVEDLEVGDDGDDVRGGTSIGCLTM